MSLGGLQAEGPKAPSVSGVADELGRLAGAVGPQDPAVGSADGNVATRFRVAQHFVVHIELRYALPPSERRPDGKSATMLMLQEHPQNTAAVLKIGDAHRSARHAGLGQRLESSQWPRPENLHDPRRHEKE